MAKVMPPFAWFMLITTAWSWLTPMRWWVDLIFLVIVFVIGAILVIWEDQLEYEKRRAIIKKSYRVDDERD